MKSFKYLVFILVIFLKTGNVLSESTLFNVNNVEISGNLTANNQFFVNEAIKKGFNEMMNRVLLDKDINKLKNLSSNKINDLVSYYQIIETAEDRISNKVIKKYNIFFDKEKVHNLFYNFEISYSDINQYEIYFLPIHKKNNQLFVYNQNYFYERWNEADDNELIEFILPLEKIEILQNINYYQDNLYDLDHYILHLLLNIKHNQDLQESHQLQELEIISLFTCWFVLPYDITIRIHNISMNIMVSVRAL